MIVEFKIPLPDGMGVDQALVWAEMFDLDRWLTTVRDKLEPSGFRPVRVASIKLSVEARLYVVIAAEVTG